MTAGSGEGGESIADVHRVLGHYDLGAFVSHRRLAASYANINYAMTTERGTFLYRVCRQNPRERITDEMRIMTVLRAHGFPTAFPIPRRDGGYISDGDEWPVVIYEFIEGHEPQLNEDTVREIAGVVARLSRIACPPDLNARNFINVHACQKFIARHEGGRALVTDVWKYFMEQIGCLAAALREPLPRGLVHGDVFPSNTLFVGDRLRALIDFEEACTDHLLFDVGMTIHGFCFDEDRLCTDRLAVFMDSYDPVRPLSTDERRMLPIYVRWTGLGMMYWHLTQLVRHPHADQWVRVRTLMRRVQTLETTGEALFRSYM